MSNVALTKPSNGTQTVKLLDEKEAATYCGMSVSFLQKSRSNGQLGNRTKAPAFKKIGRRVLYDIKDLDEWSNSFKSLNHLAEAANH